MVRIESGLSQAGMVAHVFNIKFREKGHAQETLHNYLTRFDNRVILAKEHHNHAIYFAAHAGKDRNDLAPYPDTSLTDAMAGFSRVTQRNCASTKFPWVIKILEQVMTELQKLSRTSVNTSITLRGKSLLFPSMLVS